MAKEWGRYGSGQFVQQAPPSPHQMVGAVPTGQLAFPPSPHFPLSPYGQLLSYSSQERQLSPSFLAHSKANSALSSSPILVDPLVTPASPYLRQQTKLFHPNPVLDLKYSASELHRLGVVNSANLSPFGRSNPSSPVGLQPHKVWPPASPNPYNDNELSRLSIPSPHSSQDGLRFLSQPRHWQDSSKTEVHSGLSRSPRDTPLTSHNSPLPPTFTPSPTSQRLANGAFDGRTGTVPSPLSQSNGVYTVGRGRDNFNISSNKDVFMPGESKKGDVINRKMSVEEPLTKWKGSPEDIVRPVPKNHFSRPMSNNALTSSPNPLSHQGLVNGEKMTGSVESGQPEVVFPGNLHSRGQQSGIVFAKSSAPTLQTKKEMPKDNSKKYPDVLSREREQQILADIQKRFSLPAEPPHSLQKPGAKSVKNQKRPHSQGLHSDITQSQQPELPRKPPPLPQQQQHHQLSFTHPSGPVYPNNATKNNLTPPQQIQKYSQEPFTVKPKVKKRKKKVNLAPDICEKKETLFVKTNTSIDPIMEKYPIYSKLMSNFIESSSKSGLSSAYSSLKKNNSENEEVIIKKKKKKKQLKDANKGNNVQSNNLIEKQTGESILPSITGFTLLQKDSNSSEVGYNVQTYNSVLNKLQDQLKRQADPSAHVDSGTVTENQSDCRQLGQDEARQGNINTTPSPGSNNSASMPNNGKVEEKIYDVSVPSNVQLRSREDCENLCVTTESQPMCCDNCHKVGKQDTLLCSSKQVLPSMIDPNCDRKTDLNTQPAFHGHSLLHSVKEEKKSPVFGDSTTMNWERTDKKDVQFKSNEQDRLDRLKSNTKIEVPHCDCLGPDYQYNEATEGPFYTHLGAASSITAVRSMMEGRFQLNGDAIRIEKVRYTGKEGKSSKGCPIAKWILRRSGPDEKVMCIVKHRAGHFCPSAYIIVAIVAWEGVPAPMADEMYDYIVKTVTNNGFETDRRCGTNEAKTCACQGWDLNQRGASFSFGCSWSMYFNGCKFARSRDAKKFKLKDTSLEPILEDHFQRLATHVGPLYKQSAPESYNNQVAFEEKAMECRLGYEPGRPFSGVTTCMDFCAHAHKDLHNMNNGSTVVVTLTKHRGFDKADDEQLHVLPLYVLDTTDEFGTVEGLYEKVRSGSLEVLQNYPMEARTRAYPLTPKKKGKGKKESPAKRDAQRNEIINTHQPKVVKGKEFSLPDKQLQYQTMQHLQFQRHQLLNGNISEKIQLMDKSPMGSERYGYSEHQGNVPPASQTPDEKSFLHPGKSGFQHAGNPFQQLSAESIHQPHQSPREHPASHPGQPPGYHHQTGQQNHQHVMQHSHTPPGLSPHQQSPQLLSGQAQHQQAGQLNHQQTSHPHNQQPRQPNHQQALQPNQSPNLHPGHAHDMQPEHHQSRQTQQHPSGNPHHQAVHSPFHQRHSSPYQQSGQVYHQSGLPQPELPQTEQRHPHNQSVQPEQPHQLSGQSPHELHGQQHHQLHHQLHGQSPHHLPGKQEHQFARPHQLPGNSVQPDRPHYLPGQQEQQTPYQQKLYEAPHAILSQYPPQDNNKHKDQSLGQKPMQNSYPGQLKHHSGEEIQHTGQSAKLLPVDRQKVDQSQLPQQGVPPYEAFWNYFEKFGSFPSSDNLDDPKKSSGLNGLFSPGSKADGFMEKMGGMINRLEADGLSVNKKPLNDSPLHLLSEAVSIRTGDGSWKETGVDFNKMSSKIRTTPESAPTLNGLPVNHLKNEMNFNFGNDSRPDCADGCMRDPNFLSAEMEYNEDSFLDPEIGGVAVALTHGSVYFEVAKRELHATTALRRPNRKNPTRISMVFYQHKNMNLRHHGWYENEQKAEMMRQKRLERMKVGGGGEEDNPSKPGPKKKKKKIEEAVDFASTSAAKYKYMWDCPAGRDETLTTDSIIVRWIDSQPMVTGPYQRWVPH